jgi:hypothetical protein
MYLSEMLSREHQAELLKQAAEARLALRAAELRHLRHVQQRAEQQWHKARQRAEELRAAS